MATFGDCYKVEMYWRFAGDSAVTNVLTYRAINTACDALAIADHVDENILPSVAGAIHAAMQFEYLQVTNMADAADFYVLTRPTPLFGEVTGAAAARFLSASIKSIRKKSNMRSGFKRIGVLGQSSINGDLLASVGTAYDSLIALAAGLSLEVTVDFVDLAAPVVVRRELYTNPENGKQYYVVPPTATEENSYVADNWALSLVVTSQNTRKANRGS